MTRHKCESIHLNTCKKCPICTTEEKMGFLSPKISFECKKHLKYEIRVLAITMIEDLLCEILAEDYLQGDFKRWS